MTKKEIKYNAPHGSTHWRDMDSVCSPNEILYYCCALGVWCVWDAEEHRWKKSIIHDDNDYILDQLKPL